MKKIESFIREHRDAMDDQPAPEAAWDSIQRQMQGQAKLINMKARPRWQWKQLAAAAAIVIVLAGGWMFMNKSPKTVEGTIAANTIIEEIDPDYAKQVGQFTRLINSKQAELKQIEREQPLLYKEFMGDIQRLDSSYNALKIQLPENPNREQLLEAMIANLQLQTDLLNQQLMAIKKIKQAKTKNDEHNFKTL